MRDGLEDYEYFKLLNQTQPVAIPEQVIESMTEYTDRDEFMRAYRHRVAEAIEGLQQQ